MTTDRPARVVLATFGTHGDLHPVLAVALALKARGVEPVIVAAETYRAKVTAEAMRFEPMRPDLDDVAQHLGMQQRELVRTVARRPEFLIEHVILPHVRESYEDVFRATHDVDLVVTQSAAYGAKLAAERRGLPHISLVLQPMLLMSSFDPPIIANLPRVSRAIYRLGRSWTRAFIGVGRLMARRWARPIEALRRQIGLPRSQGHPLFEGQLAGEEVIALFSPLFGAPQPDHPPRTTIVGFAFYDSETGGAAQLDSRLERFLDDGAPPIVFTQGTSAVHDADDFIRESLAAIAALGTRAVFVLDAERAQHWSAHASASIHVTAYAPYSKLFPRALINVHHGGVGTTAQALRAGRPQLIAPYLVDQPDNAARVARLGVGRVVDLPRYRSERVIAEISTLMSEPSYEKRAREVGAQIQNEDGAQRAAEIIVTALAKLRRKPS